MLTGEARDDEERARIAELCRHFDAAPPPDAASFHTVELGAVRLKWERHTEFSSYTLFRPGPFEAPFDEPATAALPKGWLAGLPGQMIVAIQIAVESESASERTEAELAGLFAPEGFVGSHATGGAATVWTDFRLHGAGFSRFLVRDRGMSDRQAGRLVQRLAEIETYRMMALLAFPLTREIGPQLGAADSELAKIMGQLAAIGSVEDEGRLLDRLTRLAVESERIGAESTYRFSASRAYYALVRRRVDELREQRIEGLQTIGEFMDRRLAPAMRTCESVAGRQETLSERINRASALLRTRVSLGLESQNQALLQSMDRRARLQLRLQQTVEGLSVAAISYYVISILKFALHALKEAGVPVNVDLALGAAIVIVVVGVSYGVLRVRRMVERGRSGDHGHPLE